ncbi:hypothetical protein J6A31_08805 [bacterium]|nr:hypothetical protein [bacterium]
MADVLLKNASGQEESYEDIDTVTLKTTDGGTTTYVSEHLILNQVQADWNQTDDTQPDYIKNKPETFESEDELPAVTTEHDGSFLGVLGGEWTIVPAPEGGGDTTVTGLPDVTEENNGMILGVTGGEWAVVDMPEVEDELPVVTDEDNGNILSVIEGKWQKMKFEDLGDGLFVQSDYTQNDETANDYIKNRPFYVGDAVMTEALPTTTLPFTYSSSDGVYVFEFTPTAEQLALWLSDWTNAEFTWGETTYTCQPQYVQGMKCIGNVEAAMGTGDNGMPFVFMMADAATAGANICMIMSLEDAPPEDTTTESTVYHDIAMSMEQQTIVTLDPKFLGDVPWDKITNKPFGDVAAGSVAVEETTVTIVDIYGMPSAQGFTVNESNFVVGATYNITVNGTAYEGECIYDADDFGAKIIQWSDGMLSPYIPMLGTSAYLPNSATIGDLITIEIVLASDAVAKIDSKYIPEIEALPEVTTDDNGKTLVVSEGAWVVGSGLPTVTSDDNGKTLVVSEGAWTVGSGLPSVTTDDAGKFLRVSDAGAWIVASVSNAEEVSF